MTTTKDKLMHPAYMTDADELPHEVAADVPLFSENYLDQAYSPENGVGIYFHFNRPPFNPHLWHEIFAVYLPNDEFLVSKSFLKEEPGLPGPRAAGMSWSCDEPWVQWTKRFSGAARHVSGDELRSGPLGDGVNSSVEMELTFRALAPAFDVGDLEKQDWATYHYEQHGQVTGQITHEGTTYEFDGTGLRDHSWGPRDLRRMANHAWIQGQFPSGRNFMIIHVINRSGSGHLDHSLLYDGENLRPAKLVKAPLITKDEQQWDPAVFEFETDSGIETIRAEVLQSLPLLTLGPSELGFGTDDTPDVAQVLYDCQARYEWDGEVGYGLLERSVMRPLSD